MKHLFLTILACFMGFLVQGQIYSTNTAFVKFCSNAPLEIIKAESDQLKGVLNLDNKTFAFKLFIKTFQGFNSPLQQEHFYENYLEVRTYPESVFQGKILEDIDINNKGPIAPKDCCKFMV